MHPVTSSVTEKSLPRARLLTSDESSAMLEEKENKKKRELEQKENRKQEGAEKKRIREETAKRNKEQRAQKAQERLQRKQGKANAVSQRVSRKKKNSTATSSIASIVDVPATNGDDSDVSDVADEELQTEVSQQKNAMDNEDIDLNICCMGFQSWHDDVLEGGGQSGSPVSVGDGCMRTALKMLHQTMMDFSVFVLFVLTNTLCKQLIIVTIFVCLITCK